MQLKDYIGEATAYDKKLMLERKDPTSWLKSVSAFANTQGGRLLFGVANDGALAGLADAQSDAEFISEAIKAQMDPVPEIDLSLHEEDSKRFVVVEVKAGSETPYYTFVKGHRDAYIRIGNNVTSIRRNPVIADLFQRLDLMERRGSGFKKILGAYTFESEKRNAMIRPEFRSIRSAFFAVLPNLNYGRTIGQVAGQVTDQVTGQVAGQLTDALTEIADSLPVNAKRLLRILETDMDSGAIMSKIRLSSRGHLRKTALNPALESGLVEMTQPNSPRSPTQKYRLTTKGRELLAYYAGIGTDGKSDGTMPICTTTKTTNKATNDPTNKTTNNPANKSSDKRSVVTLTAEALAVLREFEKDGSASAERVAKILKLTPDGVRYHIKNLRAAGRLMRVGNRRVGNWIVVNETIADAERQGAKRKGGGK